MCVFTWACTAFRGVLRRAGGSGRRTRRTHTRQRINVPLRAACGTNLGPPPGGVGVRRALAAMSSYPTHQQPCLATLTRLPCTAGMHVTRYARAARIRPKAEHVHVRRRTLQRLDVLHPTKPLRTQGNHAFLTFLYSASSLRTMRPSCNSAKLLHATI
jgi:hypothetical protein